MQQTDKTTTVYERGGRRRQIGGGWMNGCEGMDGGLEGRNEGRGRRGVTTSRSSGVVEGWKREGQSIERGNKLASERRQVVYRKL